jgi:hypothetical protein
MKQYFHGMLHIWPRPGFAGKEMLGVAGSPWVVGHTSKGKDYFFYIAIFEQQRKAPADSRNI